MATKGKPGGKAIKVGGKRKPGKKSLPFGPVCLQKKGGKKKKPGPGKPTTRRTGG